MKQKASPLRVDKNKLKVVTICVLLCASNFLPALEAKKTSKSRGKSSSSSVSTGRVAKPSQSSIPSSYSNPGSLSYGSSYQQKPKPAPSAPVDNSRPIGWNVNQNQAAKPAYPVQAAAKPAYPVQGAANPPYPVQGAAKPAYPVQPAANPSYPVQAKPAYPVQGAANPPYPVQGAAKPAYPVQQYHNTHQAPPPPPPYGAVPQHGGPPPYSAINNPNAHSPFNQAPPAYSPGNQGFRPGQPGSFGGYQQSGYGGQAGGYHPPSPYGGFPSGGQNYHAPASGFTGGLPYGGLSHGGVAPPVNYAPAPAFPISAIPAGAYKPQSSGIGIGGIAAGVGTGLLAGAAGAAIYNALKPEDRVIYRDRTTIINVHENKENAAPAAAAPAAVAPAAAAAVAVAGPASGPPAAVAPAPVAPVPGAADPNSQQLPPLASADTNPQQPPAEGGAAASVPNTPIIMNTNGTEAEQAATANNGTETATPSSETPLAAYDGTTPAPPTSGKQYYPPPGQYYPATGQYVPPGEYDFGTGVFTPGRYLPDTNIFQQGRYDPLTQIFTPGSYDVNGTFIEDPNNGPINLGAPLEQAAAAVTSQPLSAAPGDVSVGAAPSMYGMSSLLMAIVPAMLAAIVRYQL